MMFCSQPPLAAGRPLPGAIAPFSIGTISALLPSASLAAKRLLTKAKLLFRSVPAALSWELSRAIRSGDAVHVRCPGNLGLIGSILGPLFSKHRVAKYAGQWSSGANDPWTNRFQRALLRSRWWGSPVTVYGRWPNQPDHIIPFFNSAMTDAQVARARAAAARRSPQQLRNILFVGRLSRAKNVHVLLNALGRLRREGIAFTATIAGEGPEGPALQKLSADLNLSGSVEFTGGVSFEGGGGGGGGGPAVAKKKKKKKEEGESERVARRR